MKTKFFNIIPSEDNTAAILLYGDVGDGCQVDSGRVVTELMAIESQFEHIDVRINSKGGDVFSGMAIYQALKNSKADITIYVDGVAASIAAIIALCGKPLYMSPFAKLMLHNVSGGTYGDSKNLRNVADQMDALSSDLAKMIADRCGMKPEEVKNKYFDGSDHWIDAKSAVEMKLADGIYDMEMKDAEPSTTEEIYKYFNNRLHDQPIKNQDMALIDDIKSLPTFSNAADGAAIVAQIKNLESKAVKVEALEKANLEYKAKLEAMDKKSMDEFLNKAVADGKITKEQLPSMEALMKADRKSAEELINSMSTHKFQKASEVFQEGNKAGFENKSWNELDKEGRLAELKAQNIELFKAKYKAQFGVDYLE